MNRSRSIPSRHDDRSSLDALNRTIEGLEARIAGLMHSSRTAPEPNATPAEWSGRNAAEMAAAASNAPPAIDPLQEIRERQRMLATGRERLGNRPAARPHPADTQFEQRPARTGRPTYPAAPDHGDFSLRGIAEALVGLRQELKQDIAESVAREFGAVRSDLRGIRAAAESQHIPADLGDDLARLAEGIEQMGRRGGPEAASLRSEYEELRRVLDGLAREESVERLDMRWQRMEDQMSGIDTRELREELVGLAYRIDEIKSQLGAMSDSPAIRALEQKLLAVAGAMEQLGSRMHPNDAALAEQFATLDDRLDEISRAIVANGRASSAASMDQSVLQRLENRLGLLAEQIDRMAAPQQAGPAPELSARIEALSERIEQLSDEQLGLRLEERLDQLSLMLSQSRQPNEQPDLNDYLVDISEKIGRLEHGAINDSLAERLDYLARRIDEIDHRQPVPGGIDFDRIEDRLSTIAARLDEATLAPAGDSGTLRNLESQIAHLSALMSEPRDASLPEAAIEHRMAALETYMSTSDEYIIEAARQAAEAVVEAYSRPGGISPPPADMTALTALAEDLRHLEDLTRSSEERSHHTFTALHTTLVQIADRLDSMEDRIATPILAEPTGLQQMAQWRDANPTIGRETTSDDLADRLAAGTSHAGTGSPDEPPGWSQEAALASVDDEHSHDSGQEDSPVAPADADSAFARSETNTPKPGLLGAISRRLRPGQKQAASKPGRTLVEPVPALEPLDMLPPERENDLLEPGSGAPDIKKILERVRASQAAAGGNRGQTTETDRADYIAAARRAAKAAALETDPSSGAAGGGAKEAGKSVGRTLSQHRRPIMMAVGAVLLALMALPLARTLTGEADAPMPATVTELPAAEVAPQTEEVATVEQAVAAVRDISGEDSIAMETLATADVSDSGALAGQSVDDTAEDTTPPAPEAEAPQIIVPASIGPKSLADAAEAGDPVALFEIGARYTDGRGVASDSSEAATWYKLAADRGLAPAQYRLANLFEKGTGVEQDLDKAIAYYRQAADAGNASAMHNLAVLYASGNGGEPDYAAAVEWFSKAAELGVSDSQFNLAILYARGNGVQQDLEASYKWFAIAAKDGDQDAAQKRDEVAKAMRPDQRNAARAAADNWKAQPLNASANGVDLPDAWAGEKPLTTASVDMEMAVQNIQAILNKNGFDAGLPDGKLGRKTISAIKAFQTSLGQEPTGKLSDALVKELLARNA